MQLAHTAAELKQLQARYTGARVFIVGVELGLDENILIVAAPVNPTFHPAAPFGVRTVPPPKHSQPARWVRICGLWFLCAVTVKDALERLSTFTSLGPGEEPTDLFLRSADHRLKAHINHAADEAIGEVEAILIHGNPMAPSPKGSLTVSSADLARAEARQEATYRQALCGCGDPVCAHGHCATCDPRGLACGDCAPTGGGEK